MPLLEKPVAVWRGLSPDGRRLFITRGLRLFAYGMISVVLVLYLRAVGISDRQVGLLLTLTLVGDTAVSLWLTTTADRWGRKRTLILGAALMFAAGIVFISTGNFLVLLLAATLGVISPSGNEVGPFLSVEQAALAQSLQGRERTSIFAWYNLAGSLATALGALAGGGLSQALRATGMPAISSYRVVLLLYAGLGLVLMLVFLSLSTGSEAPPVPHATTTHFGLHRSRKTVLGLAALFALDAFGGGFVVQSIVAYWFNLRFGVQEAGLGAIFFGANVLAGFSGLLAARVAARIGLINTMVLTHLPSNVLLLLVPLMPNAPLAVAILLLRFSISQMDVPTRQSYTLAVVDPDERSAASGVTGVARTTGAALAPALAGMMLAIPALISVPFFAAGGLKIVYDLLLFRAFRATKPAHELAKPTSAVEAKAGAPGSGGL